MITPLRALSFGALACFLAACGDSEPSYDAPKDLSYEVSALYERGPYDIGHRQTTIGYEAPGLTEERTLPIRVWYPADPEPDAVLALYKLAGILKLNVDRVWRDAPLARLAHLPVALYSHGSGGDGVLGYPFAELMASRGWVVISVEHSGNSSKDLAGGKGISLLEAAVYRPLDVRHALDDAEDGFGFPEWDDRLATKSVFMFGHSFGGYTSLAMAGATPKASVYDTYVTDACADEEDVSDECMVLQLDEVRAAFSTPTRDNRVSAIGLQAAATIGGLLDTSTVVTPTLMMSGDMDITTPHERDAVPIWTSLTPTPRLWVRFETGGHLSFITMCEDIPGNLLSTFQPNAENDGCGEQFRDQGEIVDANAAFLTAFAEKKILGVDAWDTLLLEGGIDNDVGTSILVVP